jgi:nitrite reductase/ring-hydroxylating ferredoxin subunit
MDESSSMVSKSRWWAVARSEEVTSAKPLNVDLGDQPVVLWRDAGGVARALEDRCPHRRAPLSLGCVLGNGMIQCGYHGWTYDGATGHLKDIPNLKGEQKFPPLYRAMPFAVCESGGFVRISADPKAVPPAPDGDALPLSGTTQLSLPHSEFLNALYDDPALVLSIRGIRFTPYLATELIEANGRLVMERNCQWAGPRWPAPFIPEFPASLHISTEPETGESDLILRDADFNELLRVVVAPVPAGRGVTQVRWRARLAARRPGLMAKFIGAGTPFAILPAVDGAALRVLRPSVSVHAEALRQDSINRRTDTVSQTLSGE